MPTINLPSGETVVLAQADTRAQAAKKDKDKGTATTPTLPSIKIAPSLDAMPGGEAKATEGLGFVAGVVFVVIALGFVIGVGRWFFGTVADLPDWAQAGKKSLMYTVPALVLLMSVGSVLNMGATFGVVPGV